MKFDWLLYLKVADELMKLPGAQLQEAGFRSSTSRSYYGVFGEAREILEDRGYKFDRRNIHQEVIKTLKDAPNLSQREAGVYLDMLRKERNMADYDGSITFKREKAVKAHELAQKIADCLKDLKR